MADNQGTPAPAGSIGPFEQGLLMAFAALKLAIQKSPGFNDAALQEAVDAFIASRPHYLEQKPYEAPLLMLKADYRSTLNEIKASAK